MWICIFQQYFPYGLLSPPGNSSKNTKAEKKRNVVKIHELTGLRQIRDRLQNRQIWPIGKIQSGQIANQSLGPEEMDHLKLELG